MKNSILSRILANRPKLAGRYNSEQYKLSKEILFWKHTHEYTIEKMAAILNISVEEYLEFEGGYTNHSVEEYHDILMNLRIQEHIEKHRENHLEFENYTINTKLSNLSPVKTQAHLTLHELLSVEEVNQNNTQFDFTGDYFEYEKAEFMNLDKIYSNFSLIASREIMYTKGEYEFDY